MVDYEDDEGGDIGEGSAETAALVHCPYCGEGVEITLDPTGGGAQEYVEDCEVCCNPWSIRVRFDAEGQAQVAVTALDG